MLSAVLILFCKTYSCTFASQVLQPCCANSRPLFSEPHFTHCLIDGRPMTHTCFKIRKESYKASRSFPLFETRQDSLPTSALFKFSQVLILNQGLSFRLLGLLMTRGLYKRGGCEAVDTALICPVLSLNSFSKLLISFNSRQLFC